jgi:hypothetical protein
VSDVALQPASDRASARWRSCSNIAVQKFPRVLKPNQRGQCVILKGFWGSGAALVPERRDDGEGFRVLRPFSFVDEPNPSLGSPEWSALTALLVDQGWVAESKVDSVTWSKTRDFAQLVVLVGVVWPAPREVERLWEALSEWKLPIDDSGPYGASKAPFVLEELTAD